MKAFTFNAKHESSIVGKAIDQNISDLSESEIERVYKNVVGPKACKKVLNSLINRGLTMQHIVDRNFEYNF
jgi:hypothetical protein